MHLKQEDNPYFAKTETPEFDKSAYDVGRSESVYLEKQY